MTTHPSRSVYLFDLESELRVSSGAVAQAILIEALFARQVCLTAASVIDNAAVRKFFIKNARGLRDLAAASNEIPMVAWASRFGQSPREALVGYLEPQGEPPEPAYFSSLPRDKNAALRADYRQLAGRPDALLARFLEIAGPEYLAYLDTAQAYFETAGQGAIAPTGTKVGPRLFDQVLTELTEASRVHRPEWAPADWRTFERVATAIEAGKGQERQRRQQLHNAIFAPLQPPRYHGGIPDSRISRLSKADRETLLRLDSWRFAVNTIWNWNFCRNLGLAASLHGSWLDVGKHLWLPYQPAVSEPTAFEAEAECKLYYDLVTFDFVREVRRHPRFTASVTSLYTSARGRQAIQEHVELIASMFAERLARVQAHLVRPSPFQVIWSDTRATATGTAVPFFALSVLEALGTLPSGTSKELLQPLLGVATIAFSIEARLKGWFAHRKPRARRFKRFLADLSRAPEHHVPR